MIRGIDDILNFIGACIRWCYGYLFETALGQKNFTFDEFLNGSENKNDFAGRIGHRNVNRFFAALIIIPLIMIFLDLMKLK